MILPDRRWRRKRDMEGVLLKREGGGEIEGLLLKKRKRQKTEEEVGLPKRRKRSKGEEKGVLPRRRRRKRENQVVLP